jgi:hypothetical protein
MKCACGSAARGAPHDVYGSLTGMDRRKKKMKQRKTTSSRCKPEIIEAILKKVSEGAPLRQVVREGKDLGYPPESTFREWVKADEVLAARYAHARALQIDALADELLVRSKHRTSQQARHHRKYPLAFKPPPPAAFR